MSYEMSKKCFHSVVCYPQRAQGPENILRLSDSTQISLSRLTRQSYEIYISQSRSIPIDDNHFHTCPTCLSLRLAFDGRYRRSIAKLIHCMA